MMPLGHMYIQDIELANFRRLGAVRIELARETTLFVGANNSGKTSAMVALRRFLVKDEKLTINDFSLFHWPEIVELGKRWESERASEDGTAFLAEWVQVVPCLDLWLHVENDELHHVAKIIPTLDWRGGLLGVRLRFQPTNPEALLKGYRDARRSAEATIASHAGNGNKSPKLWPADMIEFLSRHLNKYFAVHAYLLDANSREEPEEGIARPQRVPADAEPLDENPLCGLIRIDEISAQRGLGDESGFRAEARDQRKLSEQLCRYFNRHLDPSKDPTSEDLSALMAIEEAQSVFDEKLKTGFSPALKELAQLGYPGLTDPRVTISTRLSFVGGLEHPAAVQYEVGPEQGPRPLRLPEDSNGLGYQNLISMSFRLMSFRDAWMRAGKAEKDLDQEPGALIEPLHLVLVEEPEAYLHPQVQQVFIKKAYEVLRQHEALRSENVAESSLKSNPLHTQLVVSTHSSHVTHEVDFAHLRYFRRSPSEPGIGIPTSIVVNLSTVFGDQDETRRFVTRYIRAYHCDMFFADAAILVEGSAERILIPHFIREHFPLLNRRYISLLEIGGSHAHRLKSLIETLGLTTLIITDLDASDKDSATAVPVRRGAEQVTSNPTLRNWLPKRETIDELLALTEQEKEWRRDALFAVRVAYQLPSQLQLGQSETQEVIPHTFEDALILGDTGYFESLDGRGLTSKVSKTVKTKRPATELAQALFNEIRKDCTRKAEFALDIMSAEKFKELAVPKYISEGLQWLQDRFTGPAADGASPQNRNSESSV
jgi:predicted ATP-dependent endonuclease of OLD family